MGEEEKGAHLAQDGDDAAGRGVFGGGEAENIRVSGGGAARARRSWRRVELLEGGQGRRSGARATGCGLQRQAVQPTTEAGALVRREEEEGRRQRHCCRHEE
jgi:hypothetical protein